MSEERDSIVVNSRLSVQTDTGYLLIKMLLYPEHCKDKAAEKEGKVGGRVDWWQEVQLVHLENFHIKDH